MSGLERDDVADAGEFLHKLLAEIYGDRFSVNKFKSKFTHIGRKIKLLGMVVLPNGTVTVDIKMKRKIKSLIYYYMTDSLKFLTLVDDDLHRGKQIISGHLSYLNTVDKDYLEKLRRKYGAETIDMFLHLPTP